MEDIFFTLKSRLFCEIFYESHYFVLKFYKFSLLDKLFDK